MNYLIVADDEIKLNKEKIKTLTKKTIKVLRKRQKNSKIIHLGTTRFAKSEK